MSKRNLKTSLDISFTHTEYLRDFSKLGNDLLWEVVKVIEKIDGPFFRSDIVKHGISNSKVTQILTTLAEFSIVNQGFSSHDKRIISYTLNHRRLSSVIGKINRLCPHR